MKALLCLLLGLPFMLTAQSQGIAKAVDKSTGDVRYTIKEPRKFSDKVEFAAEIFTSRELNEPMITVVCSRIDKAFRWSGLNQVGFEVDGRHWSLKGNLTQGQPSDSDYRYEFVRVELSLVKLIALAEASSARMQMGEDEYELTSEMQAQLKALISSASLASTTDVQDPVEKERPPSGEVPYGIAVPGKPGYFRSPYAAKNQLVDATGLPTGMEVKCPYSGKLFRIPPQ